MGSQAQFSVHYKRIHLEEVALKNVGDRLPQAVHEQDFPSEISNAGTTKNES
jgi:hypothetical protein